MKEKDFLNKGERYDPNIAEYYDACHLMRYEFASKQITKDKSVIDIACGTGWGSKILAGECNFVFGIDISKDAIKFAKKNYAKKNIHFIQSDFFDFFRKGDIVISFETLEHIKASSFDEILSKLFSLGNKMIVGSVPYEEVPGNNPYHVSFHLNESNFNYLKGKGQLTFLYQQSDGTIHNTKEFIKPQNLIFLFRYDSINSY